MIAPTVVIAKKFIGLFVAHPGIDQDESVALFYKQTSCRDIYHIVSICRVGPMP